MLNTRAIGAKIFFLAKICEIKHGFLFLALE